jgi:mannose-6-phosphate isomerase-like protein (cupin superfamily)
MFGSFINQKNIEKIKQSRPFVVKSSGFPSIDWQEVITLLDYDINHNRETGSDRYGTYGFMLVNAERLNLVSLFLKELYKLFDKSLEFAELNKESNDHQIYISLTTDKESYGSKHHDYSNVVFWQLNGISRWKIYNENGSDIELDEILNPGDIVYCPAKRQHEVVAITPRCGVSLGLGEVKT